MFRIFRSKPLASALLALSMTVAVGAAAQSLAPSEQSLRRQIRQAGGWQADLQQYIIVLNGGGQCSCEHRDPETGICDLWVCGNEDWGPVRVPAQ
jgi:hypothetical protein